MEWAHQGNTNLSDITWPKMLKVSMNRMGKLNSLLESDWSLWLSLRKHVLKNKVHIHEENIQEEENRQESYS